MFKCILDCFRRLKCTLYFEVLERNSDVTAKMDMKFIKKFSSKLYMMKGYKIIHNKPEKKYDYLPHTIDRKNKM